MQKRNIIIIMANCLFGSKTIFRQQLKFQMKRYFTVKPEHIILGSIQLKTDNPFDLFKEWLSEGFKTLTQPCPITFILSNCCEKHKVTSRVMKFIEQKNEKFVFIGNGNTEKFRDMIANPHVAMCFWWYYNKEKHFVLRQVRVQGTVKQLPQDKAEAMFKKLPEGLKIEFHVSRQNEPVEDWTAKQEEYMKKSVQLKKGPIQMPNYMTAFETIVNEIQFFHNAVKLDAHVMPDRVLFTRDGDKWKAIHIAT